MERVFQKVVDYKKRDLLEVKLYRIISENKKQREKRDKEKKERERKERQTYVNPSTDRGVLSDPN